MSVFKWCHLPKPYANTITRCATLFNKHPTCSSLNDLVFSSLLGSFHVAWGQDLVLSSNNMKGPEERGEDKIIEWWTSRMFIEQCGTMSDCVCIGLWQVTPLENREIVGEFTTTCVFFLLIHCFCLTWSMILPSPSSGPFMLLGDKTRSSRNL